jgi:hypothetical protein
VLRASYAPLRLAEGWYTRAYSFDPTTTGAAAFRIAAWLVRDFAFLGPLAAVAVLTLLRGRPPVRRILLYALVWMGGWLAVYLPWPATFEYHLLPFALGAAVLGGVSLGAVWDHRHHGSPARRGAVWLVLAAAGLGWGAGLVNAAADARIQLTVDRANAELIDFLGEVPGHSRVVLNTARVNEYLHEIALHLAELKRRPDVRVEQLSAKDAGPGTPSPSLTFVVTPEMANRPLPTVRIALDEPGVRHANAILRTVVTAGGELVYRGGHRTPVLELGLHRLLCRVGVRPFLDPTYCPADRGLLDRRTFSYGWQVHRLGPSAPGPRAQSTGRLAMPTERES